MNFWSLIKEIISPLVAVISIYLLYKSRISPYREMLYSKQVEGYSEIINLLNDLYYNSQVFIGLHGPKLNDGTRLKLREKTEDQSIAFHYVYQKWAIFLPEELYKKIHDFFVLYSGISAPKEAASKYKKEIVYAKDPAKLLGNKYFKVFNTFRKFLGTEPLSQEALKLIKKVSGVQFLAKE